MQYFDSGHYDAIESRTALVPYHPALALGTFDCGIADYNDFLLRDAAVYIAYGITAVHVLVERTSEKVLGYLALLADSVILDSHELLRLDLEVPFKTIPALKVGKLATIGDPTFHYGSYLLYVAVGFGRQLQTLGVGCRFLTVDVDTEFNDNTPEFYRANGFVANQHQQYQRRTQSVSMRYDLSGFPAIPSEPS